MFFDQDVESWAEEARLEGNPLLAEWFRIATNEQAWEKEYKDFILRNNSISARQSLVEKYAWAVPCNSALEELARLAPLVEIGAGVGYWAWLLRNRGVDIAAYDECAPHNLSNQWHLGKTCWTPVEKGGPEKASLHPDRALFLCWPPMSDMADRCLKNYQGSTVAFIGEGDGGCTGSDEFFDILARDYAMEKEIEIPRFLYIHDSLRIYIRSAD